MKHSCILLCLFLCTSLSLFAQIPDIVETEGIKTELQKNNVGKIFFTDRRISNEALLHTDFLQTYTLTNKSDLFFVAFFDNSLTNYKHSLSPDLSADSLYKIGNYQFTLFIDDKEIYRSNLLQGAPQVENQHIATSLNRPFIDNINGQGTWSESFWNRFLYNGGDSVLTDGSHRLRMEIRPYIMLDTIKTGGLMACGELTIQVLRHPEVDISKIRLNNVVPYNGFAVSKALFDSNKIKELKGSIDEGIFKKINSVIVVKNGELLIEEYFNGTNRNTLHDPRSVGKSFASTLMGIAIADGYIKSENQQLRDFYNLSLFEHYNAGKENTSIQELLTMSSGFDGNDEDGNSSGNEDNMYPTTDWVKFALDLSFQDSIKGQWQYFTAGVVVLGDILNKTIKSGLKKYADEKLFKPLGIADYQWQYTPQQVPNTAGGLQMNALDFAKYGQLYKNEGIWNGKQIISIEWVNKTFTKQKQITGRNNEYYGYLFWNKSFQVDEQLYEAFYCAGNGGNYILVFKDQPLVIVITASAYGQSYAHQQITKILSDYILPAVLLHQ
ncbi:MAG: beta-lactamase family protein [Tannerella sp.]|jgi:CubicO group peptidase (beta-lactamase class C family)|nr:beta-lactamase family protein [Tannerella sp.]